jgi:hypothetical protein
LYSFFIHEMGLGNNHALVNAVNRRITDSLNSSLPHSFRS